MGGLSSIAAVTSLPPAEAGLAGRARAGDLGAFEQIYRLHVGRVHALCLRLTGDRARAEEHTQDTFVRAWQALADFRGENGLGPWLRRIAVNSVLSDRRRARRSPVVSGALDAAEAVTPAAVPAPGVAVDLERAIAALPDGAREIFVLHEVEGYRHEEIAALLDVAPGTSKAQLHRARKLLTEALR